MLLQRGPENEMNMVLKAPRHLDGKPPLLLALYLLDQYEAFMRVLFTEALLAVYACFGRALQAVVNALYLFYSSTLQSLFYDSTR